MKASELTAACSEDRHESCWNTIDAFASCGCPCHDTNPCTSYACARERAQLRRQIDALEQRLHQMSVANRGDTRARVGTPPPPRIPPVAAVAPSVDNASTRIAALFRRGR